jgi:hypothetical protein
MAKAATIVAGIKAAPPPGGWKGGRLSSKALFQEFAQAHKGRVPTRGVAGP